MSHVNLSNAREEEQRRKMRELEAKGQCHFCPEGMKLHDAPIEYEGKFWLVTRNDYPYKGAKEHFLVIYKNHVTELTHIDPEAGFELILWLGRIQQKFGLWTGALALRFGDMRYNGATLDHLHFHVVMGDVENPEHEPIRFKMSDRPDRK